jgi:hypothetical protein
VKKQFQKRASGLLGDVLRKVPLQGVAEIRVPSDLRKVLVANIDILRDNALEVFAREISKVLAKVDFQQIVDNTLKNYTLRIEARLDLVPKETHKSSKTKGKK